MVLIDMEMPKNCYECPFLMGDSDNWIVMCGVCNEVIDISEIEQKRSDVCPMIGKLDILNEIKGEIDKLGIRRIRNDNLY